MAFPFPTFTKTFHNSVYPAIEPTNAALSAKGKVVLVTGGGKGIGKSIAMAFASAGARAVIILGRTASSLEAAVKDVSAASAASGHETVARFFVADILDADAVSHAFKTVREEIGAIDVFVNNAGDLFLGMIESAGLGDYWKSFEINVKGTLNCMQAFLQSGLDRDAANPPTVINVSTIGIHIPAQPGMSSYAASKLAAWKITEYLSVELGSKLRVFSIHPGTIATDMSKKAGVPAFDDIELPGGFCAWLAATPEANFLRGRMLSCNWDVEELLQKKDEIVDKNLLTMVLAGWSD